MKKIILRGLRYIISKFDRHEDGLSYSYIFPRATYSPWLEDKEFMRLYDYLRSYTLVDKYRAFELWQLVKEVQKINPSSSILEVGVWRGGTSAIMGIMAQKLNKECVIFAADTFEGVVKASKIDSHYSGGEHSDTSIELVENLFFNTFKLENIKMLKGIFPDDTSNQIPVEANFGLIHIDVDVFKSAEDIMNWAWNKLLIGGIVVFDDFGFKTCSGITKYVENQREYKDRIVLHNLNGHGIIIKIA